MPETQTALSPPAPDDLLGAVTAGMKPGAAENYRQYLKRFAYFIGETSPNPALRTLIGMSNGPAARLLTEYQTALVEKQGLSRGVAAQHLSALRRALRLLAPAGLKALGLRPLRVRLKGYDPDGPLGVGLAGMNTNSEKSVLLGLGVFASFLGVGSAEDATRELLGMSPEEVNRRHAEFKTWMVEERRFKIRTVGTHLSSLRRFVDNLRDAGLTKLSVKKIRMPRSGPRRENPAFGPQEWVRLFERAETDYRRSPTPMMARDLLLILLLHDNLLMPGEVIALNYPEDFDPERRAVRVRRLAFENGKASASVWLPLGKLAFELMSRCVGTRDDPPGALVRSMRNGAGPRDRMAGHTVRQVVQRLARRAGIESVPRATDLRNVAIKQMLAAGCDFLQVMAAARLESTAPVVALYQETMGAMPGETVPPPFDPGTRGRERGTKTANANDLADSRQPFPSPAAGRVPLNVPVRPGPVVLWKGRPRDELLVLGDPDDPPVVLGVKLKSALKLKPYMVAQAILDSGPEGLQSLDALKTKSGCGGARLILEDLSKPDLLGAVLRVQKVRGGGGIRFDFPDKI